MCMSDMALVKLYLRYIRDNDTQKIVQSRPAQSICLVQASQLVLIILQGSGMEPFGKACRVSREHIMVHNNSDRMFMPLFKPHSNPPVWRPRLKPLSGATATSSAQ
jgi:hypothetical protein